MRETKRKPKKPNTRKKHFQKGSGQTCSKYNNQDQCIEFDDESSEDTSEQPDNDNNEGDASPYDNDRYLINPPWFAENYNFDEGYCYNKMNAERIDDNNPNRPNDYHYEFIPGTEEYLGEFREIIREYPPDSRGTWDYISTPIFIKYDKDGNEVENQIVPIPNTVVRFREVPCPRDEKRNVRDLAIQSSLAASKTNNTSQQQRVFTDENLNKEIQKYLPGSKRGGNHGRKRKTNRKKMTTRKTRTRRYMK
jgi:hypothetical protein